MSEVPKYKMITPSILSDRLRVRSTPISVRRRRPGRERQGAPSHTQLRECNMRGSIC